MKAELADGRILEFPDGTPVAVVQATVKRVLSGEFDEKRSRVSDIPNDVLPPLAPAPSAGGVIGGLEAAGSLATGIVGGLAGAVAGVGKSITSGKIRGPESQRVAEEEFRRVSGALTYRPRTEEGQTTLANIGSALSESKLLGLGPSEAITLSALSPRPLVTGTRTASNKLLDVVRPQEPAMAGVGAAATFPERVARERAASLPVPVNLTRGQATRDPARMKFEVETSKNPQVGAPLRERAVESNQRILQNFDSFVDETGAAAPDLRATGKIVDAALVSKANKAKLEIKAAYDKAREKGDMGVQVSTKPLLDYIEAKRPEAINAPVLTSFEAKLAQVTNRTPGAITINDLEEVRKMVGNLGGKDATNAHFAKEVKTLIDSLTEGVGGAEYKRARALRTRYANEFENVGVIDRLLSTKPGTKDRAVAFEDVFDHSILKGSLDDVRAVRKTLQTAGPEGAQAWRELQGQTLKSIKESAFGNAARNEIREPVLSFAKFENSIKVLDREGKLDFIFGKQGAQKLRDLRDVAVDVATVPPSAAVNTSNTAATIIAALSEMGAVALMTGIPAPVVSGSVQIGKYMKNRRLKKQVTEALGQPESISLRELAKLSRKE